jgi:NAD(P)-dependent dehydrogenase (short-subunit alcohol dehydrogenase family)
MDLRGRSTLVTGASRGLGAALARRLAAEGARVVGVARGADELARVVQEIRGGGGEAHAVVADVGRKDAAHAIAGAAAALVGPVEVVVQAASTLGPVPLRSLLDTDCESLEEALEVNVVGPFRLAKLLLAPMALRGYGIAVHITSDASVVAYPRWGAYGVSKAALDHLGRILAAELEGTGVRVLTIDPGEMDTKMHADAVPDADRSALAAPDVVAARIVRLLRGAEALPSGSRLEAATWDGR